MYGKNPIRPPEKGDGMQLSVQHIFPTLQGEGPYTGYPAVFIRLGGCNLACTFCDTEFESFKSMSLPDILIKAQELAQNGDKRTHHLIVITGGEPLRQNITPLCEHLIKDGFKVQIETNGTLFQSLPEDVSIVCSPKNTGGGYYPIREDLLPRIHALKFIISKNDARYSHVADVGQNKYLTPVYVQPMDEYDAKRNEANLELAKDIALRNGYRLSLQTHKIVGIE